MARALKLAVALGLFALGGLLFSRYIWPSLKGETDQHATTEPPRLPVFELPGDLSAELARADDLEAARILRLALDEYRGKEGFGEIRRAFEHRGAQANRNLADRLETLLNRHLYRTAAQLADTYRRHWQASKAGSAMTSRLDELRQEQAMLVEGRRADAETLFDEGSFEAAREAIATRWELEGEYRQQLDELAEELEIKIRRARIAASHVPSVPKPTPNVAVEVGEPGPPPSLPAYPHADVKRLAEARRLLKLARDYFLSRRHDPAERTVKDVLSSYSDLAYVQRNREALEALHALVRYGRGGVKGFFHAKEVSLRGKKLKLRYTFEDAVEMLDWEELPTVPHRDAGSFELARGAARGNGVMTLCNRGFFKHGVVMRCVSDPMYFKTHGLAFCQAGLETRQIMVLVTNHWFVEGENYVKERPGHSLIMIGKGTNADVPVDSPEIGFIFRVTRKQPQPRKGEEIKITFGLDGTTMKSEVEAAGKSSTMRGEAVGDDGRGISLLRPSLFVVQNNVRFKDVVIEGVLHPEFEKERRRELLDVVSTLEIRDD